MESKAPSSSLYLFKETSLDLESSRSSVVQIQLPSSSPFSVRPRQQHRLLKTTSIAKDEDTFSRHCLALSGSTHFSHHSDYPRSILWRVLQEQKILELRSSDLSKSERETRDAALIIQLCFPVPIKDGGVALADSEEPNILNIFALTKANELYTCAIRRTFFCNVGASEEDVGSWCKIYKPATFSMSTPYRLISGGPSRLIVSLTDGRVLQLTRRKEEDGSRWIESVYGDGQWSSALLGLVRWQGSNTVRYDGATLEQYTPLAMALSPDNTHIFAVCLNHTLRVWNPKQAASVFSKDLLWQHREPHDIPRVMLNPGDANLLRLFRTTSGPEGDLYYAVTFSPHDFGQFKFWGIRDPDQGETGIRDLFPESTLKAPDADPSPDSKVIWKIADFSINVEPDSQGLEMWVLMRSNRRYKLYRLGFGLQDLESQWQDCWCVVASEGTEYQALPQMSELDPEDVTEKWLEHLLRPGGFPAAVLETALCIYGGDQAPDAANAKASLRERMCSAVASRVSSGSVRLDFQEYRSSTHREWTAFYQDVQNLNKSRWEVLSLALDVVTGMPWMTFRDASSAVRSCSRAEVLFQNSSVDLARSTHLLETPSIEIENGEEPRLPDELAILIEAAARFRSSFNQHLQLGLKTALASELWLEPAYSIPLRIQAFYDRCNFAEDIATEHFTDLARNLEALGDFDNLDVASFMAIIDTFAHDIPSASSGMVYTSQGLELLISGAREMINQRERVLTDLLALVTVVEMEIDREEYPMERFDAPRIFEALVDLLKRYQVMHWLVTNTRTSTVPIRGRSPQSKMLKGQRSEEQILSSTILESLFAHDLKPQSTITQSQSEALTQDIQDLLQWVVGGNTEVNFEEVPVYIQCDLLRNRDLDLATSFFGFQPFTAWSMYIRGRFHLMKDKSTEAAIYFQKAAFKLCKYPAHCFVPSLCFLTPTSSSVRVRLYRRLQRAPFASRSRPLRPRPPDFLHPHHQLVQHRLQTLTSCAFRPSSPSIAPLHIIG